MSSTVVLPALSRLSPTRSPRLGLFGIAGQPVELPTEHEKPDHDQHTVDGVCEAKDGLERLTHDADRAGGNTQIGNALRFPHVQWRFLHSTDPRVIVSSLPRSNSFLQLAPGRCIIKLVHLAPRNAALATVQRMRQRLSHAMQKQHWPVTLNTGVATFTSPPASMDVLIRRADQLMYVAKQSGKNAVRHAVFPNCSTIGFISIGAILPFLMLKAQ